MTCSNCKCPMPKDPGGHEIPVEWSVVRIETHGRKFIDVRYHYVCQECTISFQSRQTNLPLKNNPTTQPQNEAT